MSLKHAVVTADEVAESWGESVGGECPPKVAGRLAELLDAAYTRGFQGLGISDLLETVRRVAPDEPLYAVELLRQWYETGRADEESSAGVE